MTERMFTVRATENTARQEAMRAAENAGLYVLRIVGIVPVGPWTEGDGGTFLFDVTVLGDEIPESERRALDGNR